MLTRSILPFAMVALAATLVLADPDARAALLDENFDATGVGQIPAGWSAAADGGHTVGVTGDTAASPGNSLKLHNDSATTGAPVASATFAPQASGVVRLTLAARVDSTGDDGLYVRLRNSDHVEVGGVRFDNSTVGGKGVIAYQAADGSWSDTAVTYEANTWHQIAIDFDLDAATYTATFNGQTVVEAAPFRAVGGNTVKADAASIVFQTNIYLGGGDAFVDDVTVTRVPEPGAAAMSGAALALLASRRR